MANGGARWHVIYAYPEDAANRFGSLSGYLASSTLAAQGILTSTRRKPLRYDMGTDCDGRYLDMTAVRLGLTTAQLNGSSDKYWPVVGDLVGQGFKAPDKDYLVFLDNDGGFACGLAAPAGSGTQRTPDNGHNTGSTFAILYRYASPGTPESGGLCGGAALHEMLHSMGAVQSVAPNSDGTGHCDDTSSDVMCSGPARAGGPFVDYGSDDYWDPTGGRLGWWTVNLNRFFCATTTCNNGEATRAPLSGREIGPADFIGYCKSRGEVAVLAGEEPSQPQAAFHWRCEKSGAAVSIAVGALCAWQYGTWEGGTEVLDVDDAFSWQCLRDLNPPPSDPEEEGGGHDAGPGFAGAGPSESSGPPSSGASFGPSAWERCQSARRRVRTGRRAVRRTLRAHRQAQRSPYVGRQTRRRASMRLRLARQRLAQDRRRAARACAVGG